MARPSAGDVRNGIPKTMGLRRSDRFLSGLNAYDRVVFVTHIHADPDGLGSMFGLAHLIETLTEKPTIITQDGPISRAENRALVDTLHLDLIPIKIVDWHKGDAVVMVDSQPKTGRHTFDENVPLYAVIDHHETPGDLEDVAFIDVRPNMGATCTLVTKYLIEQGVTLTEKLASSLYYGIETEVTGYPREATEADDEALNYLFGLTDKDLLAQIRNARLPHSHFECLLEALQSSFLYDRFVISWVDDLPQPEQAAEVVDFMIRFEKVDWAVCCGIHKDKLIISVRSALPHAKSGEILRSVVGTLGNAGGHDRRAGGCISLAGKSVTAIEELQAKLRRRFLKALNIEDNRGRRLVALREMLQNLQS